ncbi:MAG: type 1 glutamine amidotransferase domain-containing protein [Nannocystaceae bacterium]
MARILVPLPEQDVDPTEVGVPCRMLAEAGHTLVFATPQGRVASADVRMLTGKGLGPWTWVLRADARGREAWAVTAALPSFAQPITYDAIADTGFDAMHLPGGHAKGMRVYLESEAVQRAVVATMAADKPLGAICHGVLVAARARSEGRSVLHGRRTTALTERLELLAWRLTRLWLGDYYRTYPETVQSEVTRALADPSQFELGPRSTKRDDPDHLERGFVVRDGRYVSARWPGDAHAYGRALLELLA